MDFGGDWQFLFWYSTGKVGKKSEDCLLSLNDSGITKDLFINHK